MPSSSSACWRPVQETASDPSAGCRGGHAGRSWAGLLPVLGVSGVAFAGGPVSLRVLLSEVVLELGPEAEAEWQNGQVNVSVTSSAYHRARAHRVCATTVVGLS
jgi:hypothetical protein